MSKEMTGKLGRGEGEPSIDTLYSILSDEHRRYALHCLQQYRNPMALADLADEVARLKYDEKSLREISAEDTQSVYLQLYHNHIPKMADADMVTYDQETDSVQLSPGFDELDLEESIENSELVK